MAIQKNDTLTLDIIDLNSDGDGVARHDGQVVFVPGALPEEKVETVVINTKSKFAIAKVTALLKQSADRVPAKCKYFNQCGSCSLQHLKYEKQLEFKTNEVKKALKSIAKIDYDVPACEVSSQWNYRNKMALPVNGGKIGMYRKNTHNIVEIDDCPITQTWATPLLKIVNDFIKQYNVSLYDEQTKSGLLRHIVARSLNNQLLITLVVNGNNFPNYDKLAEMLKEEFDIFGLNLNINSGDDNVILSNIWKHLYGIQHLTGEAFGIEFPISSASFMQVNDEIKDKIYNKVLSLVEDSDVIIDAYSGAGLLSAILSTKAHTCYGVEIIPEATENANLLAEHNNIQNLINLNGDCSKILPKLAQTLQDKKVTVVLDPPRKGCDPKVLQTLLSVKPNKIIYVSCNPATLARDLSILQSEYIIKLVQPYDMFPNTPHCECLVLLNHK